ncbi:portal protein [Fictibacillus sp. Mic-4]|uniref:portal protein n=1 Tax=Fictibacillus sp. Mic-4 TaxID=3132826 RepID=UPI003CFAB87E
MPLFKEGASYPPTEDLERLAKYQRGRKIFDGKLAEVYERATKVLKETPHKEQLEKLYIAVNLMDILVTKPADLMVGEPPIYESGLPDKSTQQSRINSIVEENDLNLLIHEIVIGSGFRGDAWIKVRHGYRQDFSEVPEGYRPANVKPEPIIEAVRADYVFPEFSNGSTKRCKAINIAWVEWVLSRGLKEEIPFLNVERHLPGYIIYERFRLYETGVDNMWEVPIQTFKIGEQVATGRNEDVVLTGVPRFLVHHVPYKTVDDEFWGISMFEKLESILTAINDRITQIDYILWKHADPIMYGPPISDKQVSLGGGRYIEVSKEEQQPGYMGWEAQLDSAFKELDLLLGLVFQMSETPQWLFGTSLTPDSGGTGTSHTDGAAIKARFMPILSKVKRIRVHVDRAIRDALWTAQLLENEANDGVDGFEKYEPVYPKITWKDGIPANEKELAEIMQIRTGGKPTIDVQSAIKRQDEVDDEKAKEIISRIEEDETATNGFVDSNVFNQPAVNADGGDA